ncbi:hypothetical protein L227DRAFT_509625 [Lentinus tigrinus ALCF2SS1-6]|uniref:Uncharacterized protein n=1 Tax=Lentinus tigrinus ALCF2SS1-6 TaxID=1328759 RepID=A0A5C2RXI6_9APHY|nr:hypothetical protein L227DRAFT_509625 [Lentinus tigrinus ALCF2SS1-6]
MITGYKKKRLGHPSERLSGDVPRAKWRAVIFAEIIFPIVMAVFPDKDDKQPPSPLILIAIVSLGPVVWNAAVLLVLFLFSLFLGPMLDRPFRKFGSVMVFIGHSLGVISMVAFFEFFIGLFVIMRRRYPLLALYTVPLYGTQRLFRQ